MADVFDLYAKIRIDLTAYQNDLKRSISMAQGAADNISRSFQTAQKSAMGYGDSLGRTANETQETAGETKKYNKELDSNKSKSNLAATAAHKFADAVSTVASKAASATMTLAKWAAEGIGVASAALTKLTKDSLNAVGEFEQLEGGAQKIFDEMDFSKIAEDARNAYKDLNMSASEYLESINLAGATFAQTMGDEKGYDTARKGMLAIADFASGTGKNLNELNQKFQMITRSASVYQSIADQFAGILPQTSNDFLEQAQAAGLLSSTYQSLTEVPVAEYQQAVTDMIVKGVDKLGLSNNTLRESTETLTGSFTMAKAAWKNFIVGMGDTKTFTDALSSAIGNTKEKLNEIIPRLSTGIVEIINQLAPELPGIIESTLPTIITGASLLITSIAENLPHLIETVLPSLTKGVTSVVSAVIKNFPQILQSVGSVIPIIIEELKSHSGELFAAAGQIFGFLSDGLVDNAENIGGKAVDIILKIGKALTSDNVLGNLLSTSVDIISGLLKGMTSAESMAKILLEAPTILSNIIKAIGGSTADMLDAALEVIGNLFSYMTSDEGKLQIKAGAEQVMIAIGQSLEQVVDVLKKHVLNLMTWLGNKMVELFDGDMTASELLSKLGEGLLNMNPIIRVVNWFDEKEREAAENEAWSTDPAAVGMSKEEYLEKIFYPRAQAEFEKNGGIEGNLGSGLDLIGNKRLMNQKDPIYNIRKAGEQLDAQGHVDDRIYGYSQSVYGIGGSYDQAAAAADYVKQTGAKGVPIFGNGGIVTKPTFALIGEDGAEAVVPLEKDSEVGRKFGGSTYNVTVNMTVNASALSDIENAGDEMIRIIDTRLRQYQVQQVRGQGGTAW